MAAINYLDGIGMGSLCSVKLVEHPLFIYENMSLCTKMLARQL